MTHRKMKENEKSVILCMILLFLPIAGTIFVGVLIYTKTWIWFLIIGSIIIVSIILLKYFVRHLKTSNWYIQKKLEAERKREEIKRESERIKQEIQVKIESHFRKIINKKLTVSIKRKRGSDYVVFGVKERNTPKYQLELGEDITPSIVLHEMGSDFSQVYKTIRIQFPHISDKELSNRSYYICEKYLDDLHKKVEEERSELLLKITASPRHIPSDIRRDVWMRDNGKCVLCGSQEQLEFDHIIPFSKGGAHSVSNIRILCRDCNRRRSNKIGDDF